MAILDALPAAAFDLAAMQPQPQAPFVWGQGGARLSPDDIARRRAIAEQQMAAGADYSPVGSWTQGLARVANGLVGAIDAKKLDKQAAENAAHGDAIMQALLDGGDGASPGGSSAVLAALTDPTVSPQVRQIATTQYNRQHPPPQQPTDFERTLVGAGILPGTPEWQAAMVRKEQSVTDPTITTTLPGNRFYSGPQSGLLQAIQGGGGQASAGPGAAAPPSTLPPDFDFGSGGPTPSASGSFP